MGRKTSKQKKLDVEKIAGGLHSVLGKVKRLKEVNPDQATADDVAAARDVANELQELNRGFREALKKAMMADGKIKPGQTITAAGRAVSLRPRPGCPEGSANPDDYDLVLDAIQ